MRIGKYLYLSAGWVCVGLGGLGIIMPVLPTTPFLLVAVWAFSHSSPELAAKIRNHPTFGPFIRNWQDHGVIPAYAKILALLMMTGASIYLIAYSPAPGWVAWLSTAAMAFVGIYVVTRPSRPRF